MESFRVFSKTLPITGRPGVCIDQKAYIGCVSLCPHVNMPYIMKWCYVAYWPCVWFNSAEIPPFPHSYQFLITSPQIYAWVIFMAKTVKGCKENMFRRYGRHKTLYDILIDSSKCLDVKGMCTTSWVVSPE